MKIRKFAMTLSILALLGTQAQHVEASIIHEIIHEQIVTRGVTHIQKEVLTSNGWQDINILRIDLSDDNVKLSVMDGEILGQRETVTSMAIAEGAVAAVNADFFDMSSTLAPAFGPAIESGQLEHAYNNEYSSLGPAKNMGTFVLSTDNEAMLDFYGVEIKVIIEGHYLAGVTSYNKLASNLVRPVIIDHQYYATNQEALTKYQSSGMYTVLIEDEEIVSISQLNEKVSIGDGQIALLVSPQTYEKGTWLLQEGKTIEIRQELVLGDHVIENIENLEMGVGGGGIIIKDGKAYTGETHKVSGNNREPRTIVATTHKDNELLLITVDGRGISIGASHEDLVQILIGLDVKDAMYLDGGGSTTMSVRDEGELQVSLQNSPSGIVERKVSNGIGVFTTHDTGNLERIVITPSRERTLVGESITIDIQGFDEYGNPVTINKEDIEVSVAGVATTLEGLTLYPEAEGVALIVATIGEVSGTVEIDVTAPRALEVQPSIVQVDRNGTKQVQIHGIDKDGYRLPISAENITWEIPTSTISVEKDTIKAGSEEDIVTITAKHDFLEDTVDVVVGEIVERIESFETNTASWAGTGTTVDGKVELSKDLKYHGDQAIKMTYTFEQDSNRQIAYTVFNQPIAIPEDAKSVNMWLNARGQGDTVKIQVEDANGKVHYLNAVDTIDFTGWEYVSVSLPVDVAMPAEVTKLYTYSDSNEETRTSVLYIDHMSATRGIRGVTSNQQDYLVDPMYKPTLQDPVGEQYIVKVIGETDVKGLTLNEQTANNITQSLNSHAELVIKASESNLDLAIQSPLTYKGQFEQGIHKDIDFIFLGSGSGSLRTHNQNEWTLMKKALDNSQNNHIVIVMGHNPLTQFKDVREGQALHDYLVEYKEITDKNIFVVIANGQGEEVHLEEGIRYVELGGLNTTTGQVQDAQYLTLKVVGDSLYYTFEPMIE